MLKLTFNTSFIPIYTDQPVWWPPFSDSSWVSRGWSHDAAMDTVLTVANCVNALCFPRTLYTVECSLFTLFFLIPFRKCTILQGPNWLFIKYRGIKLTHLCIIEWIVLVPPHGCDFNHRISAKFQVRLNKIYILNMKHVHVFCTLIQTVYSSLSLLFTWGLILMSHGTIICTSLVLVL